MRAYGFTLHCNALQCVISPSFSGIFEENQIQCCENIFFCNLAFLNEKQQMKTTEERERWDVCLSRQSYQGYIIYNPVVNMDLNSDWTAVPCATTIAHAE